MNNHEKKMGSKMKVINEDLLNSISGGDDQFSVSVSVNVPNSDRPVISELVALMLVDQLDAQVLSQVITHNLQQFSDMNVKEITIRFPQI